jgi:hypothetical protein
MAQIEMMKKEVEKQSKRISELPSSILNEVFGQYEISEEV